MKKHSLKYSFLNEDPNCERAVMPIKTETLVCVGGGGFRVLPLLSNPNLKTVYVVDHSNAQLSQAKDIVHLLNEPDYQSFVQQLRPLSPKSPIYQGQHEQSYFLRARLMRFLFLGRFKPHVDITQSLMWPMFAKLYASVLKRIKKDPSPSEKYINYLTLSFKKLTSTAYERNFFWQQFLYGFAKTTEAFTALIPEAVWVAAKNNVGKIEIHYIEQDILDFLNTKTDEIDFISFSNVINYLDPVKKTELAKVLEKSLRSKGQILIRSYIDPIKLTSAQLREDHSKAAVLENEMTGSYVMKVYEKI